MKNSIKSSVLTILLGCAAAINGNASVVSFAFSGTINYLDDGSNSLPASIKLNAPFTGAMTYDNTTYLDGRDFGPTTNQGDFYFSTNSGFSISVTVGGHTFSTVKHLTRFPAANVIIFNDYFGSDSFESEDDVPYVQMDGGQFPGNPNNGAIYIELKGTNTTYNSDALPLAPPALANFLSTHRIEIYASTTNYSLYSVYGTITNLTATGQPLLAIKTLPNKSVVLSWPIGYQSFSLLQKTNPAAGAGWTTNATLVVDTATDHTVTLPGAKAECLFRLKSP